MRDRCLAVKNAITMHSLVERYGLEMRGGRCACPIHGGNNKSAFMITPDGRGYVCNTNGCKGDVLSFTQHMEGGISMVDALKILEFDAGIVHQDEGTKKPTHRPLKAEAVPKVTPTIPKPVFDRTAACEWPYLSKDGAEVFVVKRFNQVGGPKKQVKPYTNGRPGLKDEDRILYNLNNIVSSSEDFIVLVEGEKCAKAVCDAGFIGTTNPMGSGQWDEKYGYGETLRGRDVIVFPDADDEAVKWLEAVKKDLRGKVKSLTVSFLPDNFVTNNPQFKGHDVADYAEVEGQEALTNLIIDERMDGKVMPFGAEPGLVVTPNEALQELVEMHQAGNFERIQFNRWIPGLNVVAYASDLVVVMAQTGTGKTRILHNIPYHIDNLNYMMFDLELSRGILGLRYASMATGLTTKAILKKIKNHEPIDMPAIDHIHLDNTGNIDLDYVRDRVHLVEDITQKRIDVIGIDYIGLMKKKGFNSRYGALSEHVETFKGFLNETKRTGIISTQCGRTSDKEEGYFQCPSMFAAKDSGSIENSAQLVLRAWRSDQNDRMRLGMNVGKWSHDEAPVKDFELIADGLMIMSEVEWKAKQSERARQTEVEF